MAGSIVTNTAAYKKQMYKYIAPAPPSKLIDTTTYAIDFTGRKFIHIGLDPEDQFNIAVQIITPSRFISISYEYLTRIYSLMGNILSFILETPDKTRNIIFLADEIVKLSNMVYRRQSMLVIESQIKDGCSVLLNRDDLLALQDMEYSIFEAVVRKSTKIRPMVLQQVEQILLYLNKYDIPEEVTSTKKLETWVKNIDDDKITDNAEKNEYYFISQIKYLAVGQLVQMWIGSDEFRGHVTPMEESSAQLNEPPFYSPISPPCYSNEDLSRILPLTVSPPVLNENDGPLFYDLMHVPSPPVSPINISGPKRLKKAKHAYPEQLERNKSLFQDMLCDN